MNVNKLVGDITMMKILNLFIKIFMYTKTYAMHLNTNTNTSFFYEYIYEYNYPRPAIYITKYTVQFLLQ